MDIIVGQELELELPFDISWVNTTQYTPQNPHDILISWAISSFGDITSSSTINYYTPILVGDSLSLELPFDISWVNTSEYITHPHGILISWNDAIGEISSECLALTEVTIFSDVVFDLEVSSSVIDRGNWGRSNARITSPVASQGYAEMTPIVFPATNDIGDIKTTNQSGLVIVAVIEVGSNIQFPDSISHLRGRVLFGYPKANIIREVYEMSNNRSLVIPNVPEDPSYAVFLTTTDFNLSDEELRRGTVDISFSFDHDVKDIEKISVWLQGPDGRISLDKMRIFDYPGGTHDPHVLLEPFKYTTQFRIPIHCISKKENQFFIEIEYKNPAYSELDERSRVMLEKENYIIPFQAHFDNRMPYLNIADHVMSDGPKASSNTYLFSETLIPSQIYNLQEDLNVGISQNANNNPWYTQEFVEITRIFCTADDVFIIGSSGANNNIYFIQEYTDLSSGQIGG